MRKNLHCIVATALLLLIGPTSSAQFFRDLDDWLKKRQARQVYDTTYIYRPQERWLVRTQSLTSGEHSDLHAERNNSTNVTIKAGSGLMFKQTIGGGYRGLVFDVGYVPGKLKKNADLEVKAYGNMLGFSLGGSFSYGYKGHSVIDGTTTVLSPGDIIGASIYTSAYFAINGRRFSMPAATSQNYRQLRSAGSPLVTVKAQVYGLLKNPDTTPDADINGAVTSFAGIGAGYGYNWVPGENWLIHLSLTETIGFLNDSRLLLKTNSERFVWQSPIYVTRSNFAVLYYYRKWYFGLHANAEDLLFWSPRNMHFSLDKLAWKANVTVGVRF
ncbi:MAG: DUF4421 family protein [Bacteroidales bacterium]|nr:DUF4421 family protein [Bacteroidales bacterium]